MFLKLMQHVKKTIRTPSKEKKTFPEKQQLDAVRTAELFRILRYGDATAVCEFCATLDVPIGDARNDDGMLAVDYAWTAIEKANLIVAGATPTVRAIIDLYRPYSMHYRDTARAVLDRGFPITDELIMGACEQQPDLLREIVERGAYVQVFDKYGRDMTVREAMKHAPTLAYLITVQYATGVSCLSIGQTIALWINDDDIHNWPGSLYKCHHYAWMVDAVKYRHITMLVALKLGVSPNSFEPHDVDKPLLNMWHRSIISINVADIVAEYVNELETMRYYCQ